MRRWGGVVRVHAPQSTNACMRWARTQRALNSLHHNKLCDRFPQSPLAASRRKQSWPVNSDAAPARAHKHERSPSSGRFIIWKAQQCQWLMHIEKKTQSPYFRFHRRHEEEKQSLLYEMHNCFMVRTSTTLLWLEIVCSSRLNQK